MSRLEIGVAVVVDRDAQLSWQGAVNELAFVYDAVDGDVGKLTADDLAASMRPSLPAGRSPPPSNVLLWMAMPSA